MPLPNVPPTLSRSETPDAIASGRSSAVGTDAPSLRQRAVQGGLGARVFGSAPKTTGEDIELDELSPRGATVSQPLAPSVSIDSFGDSSPMVGCPGGQAAAGAGIAGRPTPDVPSVQDRVAMHAQQRVRAGLKRTQESFASARSWLFGQPSKPDGVELAALSEAWARKSEGLVSELAAAQNKLKRSRRGLLAKLTGLVPARFVARGATVVAALMLWSAGTVTMLPFLALATLVLLLWPRAAEELSASLKGRPSKRELREQALEREVYVQQVLVELYRWAARRSSMYEREVQARLRIDGLPALEADLVRYEEKLRRLDAAQDYEGLKERLIGRLWSQLPLALAWTQAIAMGRIARQLASLMPLALYLALIDGGNASDADDEIQAAREAVAAKRPRFLERPRDRREVILRIAAHARSLRDEARARRA